MADRNTKTALLGLPLFMLGDIAFKRSVKAAFALLDTAIGGARLTGSATYDPASLVDGAGATTTVTVTGAVLGDYIDCVSFDKDLQGIMVTAYVSAADTASVRFQNESGGTLDLASGTLRVAVRKK